MKTRVEVKKTIAADPARVWRTLACRTGVDRWFPAIATCRVEGDMRYCTMAGGGALVETIHAVDEAGRRFIYSVDSHPLPVGPIATVVAVGGVGQEAEVTWSAEFDGPGVDEVKGMLEGLYVQGIEALEAYHREMV